MGEEENLPALRPDGATVTVKIAELLCWQGIYVVRCPVCGSYSGWTVRVEEDASGPFAFALCAHGHESSNPLIYPDFVWDLFRWTQEPEAGREPVSDMLHRIRWRPHRRVPHTSDGTAASALVHRDWLDGPASWWWETWPDLMTIAVQLRAAGKL